MSKKLKEKTMLFFFKGMPLFHMVINFTVKRDHKIIIPKNHIDPFQGHIE